MIIRTWARLTSRPSTRKVMVPKMWNRGNFLSVVISAVVLLRGSGNQKKDLEYMRFSTNTFLFCELQSPKMCQVWSKHYAVHCLTGSWMTPPPPRPRPRLKLALVDISSDIPTPLLSAPAAAQSQLRT